MNITGKIVQDATLGTTKKGANVAKFSIVIDESYKTRSGEKIDFRTFIDCDYWIKPNVYRHLLKGIVVELDGRLSARAWLANDGTPKAGLNFHVDTIHFRGGSRIASPTQQATHTANSTENADDLPF